MFQLKVKSETIVIWSHYKKLTGEKEETYTIFDIDYIAGEYY